MYFGLVGSFFRLSSSIQIVHSVLSAVVFDIVDQFVINSFSVFLPTDVQREPAKTALCFTRMAGVQHNI